MRRRLAGEGLGESETKEGVEAMLIQAPRCCKPEFRGEYKVQVRCRCPATLERPSTLWSRSNVESKQRETSHGWRRLTDRQLVDNAEDLTKPDKLGDVLKARRSV